jgi:hypothetical protein
MTAATLTVRGVTYTSEGDQLGAVCVCGERFAACEIRAGDVAAFELKAWIGEHGHVGIDERRVA